MNFFSSSWLILKFRFWDRFFYKLNTLNISLCIGYEHNNTSMTNELHSTTYPFRKSLLLVLLLFSLPPPLHPFPHEGGLVERKQWTIGDSKVNNREPWWKHIWMRRLFLDEEGWRKEGRKEGGMIIWMENHYYLVHSYTCMSEACDLLLR
jgi:hypothetical protein